MCNYDSQFTPSPTPTRLAGIPWVWANYRREDPCSIQNASPLYQGFQQFLRLNWVKKFSEDSLGSPPENFVNVLFLTRAGEAKKGISSISRVIVNVKEILRKLER